MEYEPTEVDKSYLRVLVENLKVGGVYAHPRSGITYSKVSETCLKYEGCCLETDWTYPDRVATLAVGKAIGITIVDPELTSADN